MSRSKDDVRDVVRRVVEEALGADLPSAKGAEIGSGFRRYDDENRFRGRELITETDAVSAHRDNRPLIVRPGAMFTPAARDAIERYRLVVKETEANDASVAAVAAQAAKTPAAPPAETPAAAAKTQSPTASLAPVVMASDHGGFEMKQLLIQFLEKEAGIKVADLGTHSAEPVDYPDFAKKVADAVASGRACRGIVIDGAGIGSAMAANKVRGIRAAHCTDVVEARNAREHNDANVLCLGGRMIGIEPAKALALVFLKTDFAGGRHQKRVEKIMGLER